MVTANSDLNPGKSFELKGRSPHRLLQQKQSTKAFGKRLLVEVVFTVAVLVGFGLLVTCHEDRLPPSPVSLARKERKMNRVMAYTVMSLMLLALGCASTPAPKGGPFNSDFVTDGVYEGSATIWPVKAVVKVAIENKRIARINILEHRTMLGGPAEEIIPARIIEKQSTNVDAVSGATMSSDAIMNAVQLAIERASKVE